MRYTFVFRGPNGVVVVSGECPVGSTSVSVFHGIQAEAERRAGGLVTVISTSFWS